MLAARRSDSFLPALHTTVPSLAETAASLASRSMKKASMQLCFRQSVVSYGLDLTMAITLTLVHFVPSAEIHICLF